MFFVEDEVVVDVEPSRSSSGHTYVCNVLWRCLERAMMSAVTRQGLLWLSMDLLEIISDPGTGMTTLVLVRACKSSQQFQSIAGLVLGKRKGEGKTGGWICRCSHNRISIHARMIPIPGFIQVDSWLVRRCSLSPAPAVEKCVRLWDYSHASSSYSGLRIDDTNTTTLSPSSFASTSICHLPSPSLSPSLHPKGPSSSEGRCYVL